jgi:hypothetical protein
MNKEDEIRAIAYGIWEKEGYPEGKDVEHWYQATQIWEEQHKPKALSLTPNPAPEVEARPFKKTKPIGRRAY